MAETKQPRSATLDSYRTRIDRVLTHIEQMVDAGEKADPSEFALDRLAEIACFSRFHFQRIYRAIAHETPAQTVRRLRLHRAATALLETDRPVAEIARAAGYGGVEAFTRAFAAAYAAGPGAFRAAAAHQEIDMDGVALATFPPRRLAAFEHRGAYHAIGPTFEKLAIWAGGQGLMGPDATMVGLYFDDPRTVPEAELRSLAAVVIGPDVSVAAPAQEHRMPGGEHFVYRLVGPYAGLPAAWEGLYAHLLGSGRTPADAPSFELYGNDPMSTAPSELITDICVPLLPA